MVNLELAEKLVVMPALQQEQYWDKVGEAQRDQFEHMIMQLPPMPRLSLSAKAIRKLENDQMQISDGYETEGASDWVAAMDLSTGEQYWYSESLQRSTWSPKKTMWGAGGSG